MKFVRYLCLIFIAIFVSGCSKESIEPIQKTGFYFDTVISITLYDSQDESILEECF